MMSKADRTYDVNMKRLALLALPTWLRCPVAGALMYAGVSPRDECSGNCALSGEQRNTGCGTMGRYVSFGVS